MRTVRLELRKFAKALHRNDTAAVQSYLQRRPDLAFRAIRKLCNDSHITTETRDMVFEFVLTHTSQNYIIRFIEEIALYDCRMSLFMRIFRLAGHVGRSREQTREMLKRFAELIYHAGTAGEHFSSAVMAGHTELACALAPYVDELSKLSTMNSACATGNKAAIRLLLDRGLVPPDAAMYYLMAMYVERVIPNAVMESTAVLMQYGCTLWADWLLMVNFARPSVQTKPSVIQTAFRIVETHDVSGVALDSRFVHVLLEAGVPRWRLTVTRFGIPQPILDELDAARRETRAQCASHMPSVLGDVVASYLP